MLKPAIRKPPICSLFSIAFNNVPSLIWSLSASDSVFFIASVATSLSSLSPPSVVMMIMPSLSFDTSNKLGRLAKSREFTCASVGNSPIKSNRFCVEFHRKIDMEINPLTAMCN